MQPAMHRIVFIAIASAWISDAAANNTMVIPYKKAAHDEIRTPDERPSADSRTSLPGLWISQLFMEAEHNFDMLKANVTSACRRDYETYKMHLQNQSVWAVRMMESSEWPVIGVLFGNRYHSGNWHECLIANGPTFKGQYCLVQANLDFKFDVEPYRNPSVWLELPDDKASTWGVLKMFERQPARVDRHEQHWGLCLPSSCTTSDTTEAVNAVLNPLFEKHNIRARVKVEPKFCKVREEAKFSFGFHFTVGLLVFIILLVIWSTVYEIRHDDDDDEKKNQSWRSVIRCFSLQCNYHSLTHIPSSSYYPGIYTVKFCSMCTIIYAHRMLYILGSPVVEAEGVELTYRPPNVELVFDGIVDAFFAISGFLTCILGIVPMKKGGVIYMIFSIIVRWLRMMPMLGMLMLFVVYILPYLGEGPLWNDRVLKEVENCKENWWTNILAINNIVHPERQCLILSYYIAVDIQLSILGAVILYAIIRNKKVGIGFMVLVLTIATALTFAVVYSRRYYGHLQFFMNYLAEPRNIEEFTELYIATYPRVGPYLMGFGGALLALKLKERNLKMTHAQVYVITGICTMIGLLPQLYGFEFYKDTQMYSALGNAIFAAVHRLLFVLPFVVGTTLYISTGLIIFQGFMDQKLFVSLGRLVYCAFLGSFVLQLYHAATQKKPIASLSRIYILWTSIGDTALSFVVSLLMYLALEGPLSNFINLLLRKLLRSYKSENELDEKPTKDLS